MKKTVLLSLFFLALLAMPLMAVWAQNAGDPAGAPELRLLQGIITGNLGFAFGLVVSVLGILVLVRGNLAGGILLIILGVLVTLAPAAYTAVRAFTCPLAEAFGGTCGGTGGDGY